MRSFHCLSALVLAACSLPGPVMAQVEPGPKQSLPVVDRSSTAPPTGDFSFRRLASSHRPATLVGEWPVKISGEAQLFIDDYLIHSMQGLERTLHQPVKYQKNPVMKPETPWETESFWGQSIWANGTIIKDPESELWRMYYNAGKRVGCLAVSKDLIEWKRPELGIVSYKGSKANNIVFEIENMLYDTISVVHDPQDHDPSRRWKASIYHYRSHTKDGDILPGIYAYYSPDGLRWTRDPLPIMRSYTGWNGVDQEAWSDAWPMPGVGDVNAITWDPRLKRFMAHVKLLTFRDKKYFRSRGISESEDFVHWTTPRVTLIPDEDDPEDLHLYGNTAWPYESMWLGTLRAYHEQASNVELQLISSRDGRHWERAGNRKPFIPSGPPGSYDQGYTTEFTNPPISVNDELWFFYASTTTVGKKEMDKWKGSICLAKLRRDGFVSLDAGDSEGWVMTRPLTLEGSRLFLNADASAGEIRVEVLKFEPGQPPQVIAGLSRKDCLVVHQDGVALPVHWKNDEVLKTVPRGNICLKIYLKNAQLYSFRIE